MADDILACRSLLRNDIPILARLFEKSFDYYTNQGSSFLTNYLQSLRTLVGLGFTVVLVEKSLTELYRLYLVDFFRVWEGDFKVYTEDKARLVQSVAEMIQIGTIGFDMLRYPRYYDEFMDALCYAIASIPLESTLQEEAERLIQQLQ